MSAVLIVLIPTGLAVYTLALAWSLAAANLAGAAVILCLVGVLSRRYGLVVAGAAVALANYVSAVLSTESLHIWASLGVGVALFVLLETAYDWIVAVRVSVSWKTYRQRARSIGGTVLVAAAGVLAFATLGYNASIQLAEAPSLQAVIIAVLVVVCGAAALVIFRSARDLPRDRDSGKRGKE